MKLESPTAAMVTPPARRRPVRELAARALGPLVAILVTGTAGAQVPGSGYDPHAVPGAASRARAAVDTRDFERLLRGLDGDESRAERELAAIEPERGVVRTRMVARGRAYYKLVRAGLLPVGGGFDALVDHATRVERLRTAIERDMEQLRELDERHAELTKELRRIRAEKAPLEVQRQAMERARVAIRQADERAEAYERAFGADAAGGQVAIYGPSADDPQLGAADGPFETMRGRLAFPLGGRAAVGDPTQMGFDSGPGIELQATRDTAVRAVYAGRVVFVGEYLDYGLSVLIDHGGEYYSMYGRLARAEVALGDTVPDRGRIGWVTRGSGKVATLHFELRRGSGPLDAARWLGL
jgi:murein DD-endopeptidase MepM/ murein hydrolase activator NlpD